MDKNYRTILLCSLKYALGRMTAAPSIVASVINKDMAYIPKEDLTEYRSVIANASSLGHDCDAQVWNKLGWEIRTQLRLNSSIEGFELKQMSKSQKDVVAFALRQTMMVNNFEQFKEVLEFIKTYKNLFPEEIPLYVDEIKKSIKYRDIKDLEFEDYALSFIQEVQS